MRQEPLDAKLLHPRSGGRQREPLDHAHEAVVAQLELCDLAFAHGRARGRPHNLTPTPAGTASRSAGVSTGGGRPRARRSPGRPAPARPASAPRREWRRRAGRGRTSRRRWPIAARLRRGGPVVQDDGARDAPGAQAASRAGVTTTGPASAATAISTIRLRSASRGRSRRRRRRTADRRVASTNRSEGKTTRRLRSRSSMWMATGRATAAASNQTQGCRKVTPTSGRTRRRTSSRRRARGSDWPVTTRSSPVPRARPTRNRASR